MSGRLQKVRDLDLSDPIVKIKMKERYGNKVPLNETVISPGEMFSSDLVVIVTRSHSRNAYMRSLRGSGAPVNGISQTQLASACLREAASAKAGAFLTSLKKMSYSGKDSFLYSQNGNELEDEFINHLR